MFLVQTGEPGQDCTLSTAEFYNILLELEEGMEIEELTGFVIIFNTVTTKFDKIETEVPSANCCGCVTAS